MFPTQILPLLYSLIHKHLELLLLLLNLGVLIWRVFENDASAPPFKTPGPPISAVDPMLAHKPNMPYLTKHLNNLFLMLKTKHLSGRHQSAAVVSMRKSSNPLHDCRTAKANGLSTPYTRKQWTLPRLLFFVPHPHLSWGLLVWPPKHYSAGFLFTKLGVSALPFQRCNIHKKLFSQMAVDLSGRYRK